MTFMKIPKRCAQYSWKNERPNEFKSSQPLKCEKEDIDRKTQAVNQVLSRIYTGSISESNLLILVGGNVVELLGKKRSKHEKGCKIPWWNTAHTDQSCRTKKTCRTIARMEQSQTVKE